MSAQLQVSIDIEDLFKLIDQLSADERERLTRYLQEGVAQPESSENETSDEMIIAGIRRGVRQALQGEVKPAMEALEALEREFEDE